MPCGHLNILVYVRARHHNLIITLFCWPLDLVEPFNKGHQKYQNPKIISIRNVLFSIKLIKIIRAFVELNILTKNWAAKILESLETNPDKKIKLKSFSNLPGVYAYAEGIKNGKYISKAKHN